MSYRTSLPLHPTEDGNGPLKKIKKAIKSKVDEYKKGREEKRKSQEAYDKMKAKKKANPSSKNITTKYMK